jgi:hypothetical protein
MGTSVPGTPIVEGHGSRSTTADQKETLGHLRQSVSVASERGLPISMARFIWST